MRPLADRVLDALPAFETAPLAGDMAACLNTEVPHVRQAFQRLETEGRAKIVRRGRGLHLVPSDYPGLICAVCRAEYTRGKKSKRRACSRKCWISLGWRESKNLDWRVARLRESHRTPEARAKKVEANNRRWSRPGEREKLSEQNRRRWADPYQNAKQAVAISEHHRKPESRRKQSESIKARWESVEGRAKLEAGIRSRFETPEGRAKFSETLKARWRDPEQRERLLKAIEPNRMKALAATRAKHKAKQQ